MDNWAWVAALSFNVATIQNILVKNYQQKIKMGAVDWSAQSPDLKPTGMMNTKVSARRPWNLEERLKEQQAGIALRDTCWQL